MQCVCACDVLTHLIQYARSVENGKGAVDDEKVQNSLGNKEQKSSVWLNTFNG